jgi:hypothetical protein
MESSKLKKIEKDWENIGKDWERLGNIEKDWERSGEFNDLEVSGFVEFRRLIGFMEFT